MSVIHHDILEPYRGFRNITTKILLVTGGNMSSNMTNLYNSAQLLKFYTEIFVVAVSSSIDPSAIAKIASSPLALHTRFLQTTQHFTLEEEYEILSSQLRNCNLDFCESNATDIIFLFDASEFSTLYWSKMIEFAAEIVIVASYTNSSIRLEIYCH